MKKIITSLILLFVLLHGFGQTQKKISLYLLGQFNQTLYDITRGNNPAGLGTGGQVFFNPGKKFNPTLELTGDVYLPDDKVYRLYPDGAPIDDVGGMINLFGGIAYNPVPGFYLSASAGSSFISEKILFGIKPALGFYFLKNQRMMGKLSYINVFNRDKRTGKDFGTLSVGIGVRLF